MARLTRQEMKTDEVQERLLLVFDFLQENYQKIILGLVGLLVLGGAVFGLQQMSAKKELAAQGALAEAMEAYAAPVDEESPEGITTDEIRRSRAEQAFEAVLSQHGGTDAAEVADVYLGLLASERGDLEAAKSSWAAYSGRKDDLLASALQLNMLAARRDAGEGEAVASELQAMVGSDRAPLPQDAVLGELGETLQALGRDAEAREHFERLIEEYPDSAYAVEARRAVRDLPAA